MLPQLICLVSDSCPSDALYCGANRRSAGTIGRAPTNWDC